MKRIIATVGLVTVCNGVGAVDMDVRNYYGDAYLTQSGVTYHLPVGQSAFKLDAAAFSLYGTNSEPVGATTPEGASAFKLTLASGASGLVWTTEVKSTDLEYFWMGFKLVFLFMGTGWILNWVRQAGRTSPEL